MGCEYRVIRGEGALRRYCERRWKRQPEWRGAFGTVDECTVEEIWERSPTDDGFTAYFILYIPARNPEASKDPSDIRKEVYENIRAGRQDLLAGGR